MTTAETLGIIVAVVMSILTLAWCTLLPTIGLFWLFGWLA